MMQNPVAWLEVGAALIWFTSFLLLGMVAMGSALVPLWLGAHGRRGGMYKPKRPGN